MSEALETPPAASPAGSAGTPPAGAHGAAAYRRRISAKQMEAEVFARATRSIREAEGNVASPLAHARAVADNRRLWDAVLISVLDPANALPKGLRAQLAGLARVVIRECDSETPDLPFVAEMNEQIAAGLWS